MTDNIQEVRFLEIIKPYIEEVGKKTGISEAELREKYLLFFRNALNFYEDIEGRFKVASFDFTEWLVKEKRVFWGDMASIFTRLDGERNRARIKEERSERGKDHKATILDFSKKK